MDDQGNFQEFRSSSVNYKIQVNYLFLLIVMRSALKNLPQLNEIEKAQLSPADLSRSV